MRRAFLWLLFAPFAALAAPPKTVLFYAGGWDEVFGRQFETILDRENDVPDMEFQAFWKAFNPEEIKSEAIGFLKRSRKPGGFWTKDPDDYEIGLKAIRIEDIPGSSLSTRPWHVILELDALGKGLSTGAPLCFRLVLIPGKGFKTPTLAPKRVTPRQWQDGRAQNSSPPETNPAPPVPHP